MMKLLQKYILPVLLLLNSIAGLSQEKVKIPDPQFRKYLDSFYTHLLDPVTKELIIQEAEKVTGAFYLVERRVESLEGIQYFKNLDTLKAFKNNLTTIPDLSGMYRLKSIELFMNKITHLPNLNKLPSLQSLYLMENQISDFKGIDSIKNIKHLTIARNRFTSIPDLTHLTHLEEFQCYENRLTSIGKLPASLKRFNFGENLLTEFPDISLAKNITDIWGYTNQITSIPDLTGYTSLKTLVIGSNKIRSLHPSMASLTALQDVTIDNNLLHEIPNLSSLVNLTSCRLENNYLSFEDFNPTSYNPHFKNWQVNPQDSSDIPKLYTGYGSQSLKIEFQSPDNSPGLIYTWYQNGKIREQSNRPVLEFNKVNKTDNGKYYCRITSPDPALSNVVLHTNTFILRYQPDFFPEDDLSLTPDGDGKNDEIYLTEPGPLHVYDSQGRLLDQLQAPCYWNGSTRYGKELPTGFYVLQINKDVTYKITIIR